MIAQSAFNASKQRAAELLISRGYEPVLPVEEVSSPTISRSIWQGQGQLRGALRENADRLRRGERAICRIVLQVRDLPVPFAPDKIPGQRFHPLRGLGRVAERFNPLLRGSARRDPRGGSLCPMKEQDGSHDREDRGHPALPDPESDRGPDQEEGRWRLPDPCRAEIPSPLFREGRDIRRARRAGESGGACPEEGDGHG